MIRIIIGVLIGAGILFVGMDHNLEAARQEGYAQCEAKYEKAEQDEAQKAKDLEFKELQQTVEELRKQLQQAQDENAQLKAAATQADSTATVPQSLPANNGGH